MLPLLLASLILQLVRGQSLTLVLSERLRLRAPFDGEQAGQLAHLVSVGTVRYEREGADLVGTQAALWFREPAPFSDWQIVVHFRLSPSSTPPSSSSSTSLVEDGMAVWYARELGQPGPVYGGPIRWTGLSLHLSPDPLPLSAPNGEQGPSSSKDMEDHRWLINGVLNHNDIGYYNQRRHDTDSRVFGSCVVHLAPKKRILSLRLTYVARTLKVDIDNNDDDNNPPSSPEVALPAKANWKECMERPNTDLPPGYFFGVTSNHHDPKDGDGQNDNKNLGDDVVSNRLISFQAYDIRKGSSGNDQPPSMDAQPKLDPSECKLMQAAFSTILGPFKPGDKSVLVKLSELEKQVTMIGEAASHLTDACGTVLQRHAAIDSRTLLEALGEVNAKLGRLADQYSILTAEQQQLAARLPSSSSSSSSSFFVLGESVKWYMGWLLGQIAVLLIYHWVTHRLLDRNVKKLI